MKKENEETTETPPPDDKARGEAENKPAAPAAENDAFDRLKEENEKLRNTIRLTQAQRQITDELAAAGARSPALLFAAVKGDLQFAANDALQHGAALIERLRREYPEQFGDQKPASIDAGAGGKREPAITRAALAKMSAAEIAALPWDDVRSVLANGHS
jgi:hypothetical protein